MSQAARKNLQPRGLKKRSQVRTGRRSGVRLQGRFVKVLDRVAMMLNHVPRILSWASSKTASLTDSLHLLMVKANAAYSELESFALMTNHVDLGEKFQVGQCLFDIYQQLSEKCHGQFARLVEFLARIMHMHVELIKKHDDALRALELSEARSSHLGNLISAICDFTAFVGGAAFANSPFTTEQDMGRLILMFNKWSSGSSGELHHLAQRVESHTAEEQARRELLLQFDEEGDDDEDDDDEDDDGASKKRRTLH